MNRPMVLAECPSCRRLHQLDAEWAGRAYPCPCGILFQVPSANSSLEPVGQSLKPDDAASDNPVPPGFQGRRFTYTINSDAHPAAAGCLAVLTLLIAGGVFCVAMASALAFVLLGVVAGLLGLRTDSRGVRIASLVLLGLVLIFALAAVFGVSIGLGLRKS